jgi:hypothetical protein
MPPADKTHHGCPRPDDFPDALELIGAGGTSPESGGCLKARDRRSAAQRPIDEGSARRTHWGECDRDRDGDKQNNQSNDDKHVDASDPGARSPLHAVFEELSTMLTYNVIDSVGEVTAVGILSPDASASRAVGPIGRRGCRTSGAPASRYLSLVRSTE